MRALILGKLNDTYERSIALLKLLHDEMLLPLHSRTGHTTHHGQIGT